MRLVLVALAAARLVAAGGPARVSEDDLKEAIAAQRSARAARGGPPSKFTVGMPADTNTTVTNVFVLPAKK